MDIGWIDCILTFYFAGFTNQSTMIRNFEFDPIIYVSFSCIGIHDIYIIAYLFSLSTQGKKLAAICAGSSGGETQGK